MGNCPEPCVAGLEVNRVLVTTVSNSVAVEVPANPKSCADVSTVVGIEKNVVTSIAAREDTKMRVLTCPDGNGHLDERAVEVECRGSDMEKLRLKTTDRHSDDVLAKTPELSKAPIKKETKVCNETKREIHIKKA